MPYLGHLTGNQNKPYAFFDMPGDIPLLIFAPKFSIDINQMRMIYTLSGRDELLLKCVMYLMHIHKNN